MYVAVDSIDDYSDPGGKLSKKALATIPGSPDSAGSTISGSATTSMTSASIPASGNGHNGIADSAFGVDVTSSSWVCKMSGWEDVFTYTFRPDKWVNFKVTSGPDENDREWSEEGDNFSSSWAQRGSVVRWRFYQRWPVFEATLNADNSRMSGTIFQKAEEEYGEPEPDPFKLGRGEEVGSVDCQRAN
jgi:hypothetical protein